VTEVSTIGLDIAKQVFQVHGADASGRVVFRKKMVRARLTRWRCRNDHCEQRIFSERLPNLASPYARRTARLAGIVRLVGHARPAERLMRRLGLSARSSFYVRALHRSGLASCKTVLVSRWPPFRIPSTTLPAS
jgi:hypothetical protein